MNQTPMTARPSSFSKEGYHSAYCVGLVFYGKIFCYDRWQEKMALTFEMCFEKRDYSKGKRPLEPKIISMEYSASLFGISKLRQHILSWKGQDTITELERHFDPYLLLEEPASIKIQSIYRGGQFVGEDIVDIQPCTSWVPPRHNQVKTLQLVHTPEKPFDVRSFLSLNRYAKEKIMRSEQWNNLQLGQVVKDYQDKMQISEI